jgi:hypothetical protein
MVAMTWSSLNKKRKRARQTYDFIPLNGVRCIRIFTYLSIFTANVHYNLVLPNLKTLMHMFEDFLFRQRNDEQRWRETSGLRAVQCSVVEIFSFKETTSCPLALKYYLRSSPQRSIAPSIFKM